jgi:hypothetical protein
LSIGAANYTLSDRFHRRSLICFVSVLATLLGWSALCDDELLIEQGKMTSLGVDATLFDAKSEYIAVSR